jgi:hypothetical protein
VRNEIWETTKDVMEKSQTRWRIFLVKDEPVDQEEIDGMSRDGPDNALVNIVLIVYLQHGQHWLKDITK